MADSHTTDDTTLPLSDGAQKLLTAAAYKAGKGEDPSVLQWALAAAETVPDVLHELYPEVPIGQFRNLLRTALSQGHRGPALPSAEVVASAMELARKAGRTEVLDRDIAESLTTIGGSLLEALRSSAPQPSQTSPGPAAVSASVTPMRRTFLDTYTVNLTAAAREGKLPKIVGREDELELIIETLCRVTKRNPALVGPAGVGKTAIVEGLAQRLVAGSCPDMLKNTTIYALQPATLIAGVDSVPQYTERVQQLIREASAPDVIIFIDEVHSLLMRGSAPENDLVTLLKPALARGDLACIAATTDDEYRRIIETDTALERRFQPIRISEMGKDATIEVLRAHARRLETERKVTVAPNVIARVMDLTRDRMPNRRYPDKGVDVLEQAVGRAVYSNRARVTPDDIGEVIERMTGTPANMIRRLSEMETAARERDLLSPDDAEALVRHLRVATSGLDIRPERPNAVLSLVGAAVASADDIAELIADHLSGSPERVIDLDFGPWVHPSDVTRLIGAGPSYVGYDDPLPIHGLIQYPWSVLLCRNVDRCHPSIVSILAGAIRQGVIVDGVGRAIRLCDCVVILTAGRGHDDETDEPIGLRERASMREDHPEDVESLGQELRQLSTLVLHRAGGAADQDLVHWLHNTILPALTERYQARGLNVTWGAGVAEWAYRVCSTQDKEDVERKVSTLIGESLLAHMPSRGTRSVEVHVDGDALRIDRTPKPSRKRS